MDSAKFQALLDAAAADEHLPSLRKRLDTYDGSEAHVLLPQIWPSIKAIAALSDFAADFEADKTEQ